MARSIIGNVSWISQCNTLKSFSEHGNSSSFGVERLKTRRKTRDIGNISM